MPTYRPRMIAALSVPVWGAPSERVAQNDDDSVVNFPVQVYSATLTRNDHNHADELEITVDWQDAGVDPRLLSNATIEFYLGAADEWNRWQPTRRDRRFVGIATDVERISGESDRKVTIKALDFTTMFLEAKPYPPEGVPTYGMTLQEAWNTIIDHTGGKATDGEWFRSAELLRDRLLPSGIDDWPLSLGSASTKRKAKDRIPVKQGTDAWAVWQMCCGMLGLISWVEQDWVVVTTSTNLYTREDPPKFIWGKNIASIREKRNCALAGKKIAVMSYDSATGKVLQSLYPPVATNGKKVAKPSRGGGAAGAKKDDYQVFEYNGIGDQGTLDTIARRVYEERVRQELEGTIVTREMWTDTVSGDVLDLLALGSGQDVRIEIDQATVDGLEKLKDTGERIAWLKGRGYSDSVAELLAKNAEGLSKLKPTFYTKSVRTTLESDESGGSFEIEITYCNRIDVTGGGESSESTEERRERLEFQASARDKQSP
jgi:hypothetical protein